MSGLFSVLQTKLQGTALGPRLFSAVLLVPFVLGAVWAGGWFYNLLIMSALGMGMYEWLRLTVRPVPPILDMAGLLGVFATLAMGWSLGPKWGAQLAVLMTLALFYLAQDADPSRTGWFGRAIWVALGIPLLAGSGLALMSVRTGPGGLYTVCYLLAVVWGTDIGAFFAGRLIGGPKLCPKISPNKTWAGLLGGMALAALSGYLVAKGFGDKNALPETVVATGLAVVAQAGDFFESYAKRRAGLKDSGALIPGHGGLLDRIDGLLFVALAHVLLVYVWR